VAVIRLLLALSVAVTSADRRLEVRAEAGLERAAARAAPRGARALDDAETDLPGLPRVERVEVRLVRHAEALADAAPPGRGAPAWAVGTAYPDEGVVVVAMRGRDGSLLDADRTLAHELAHLALRRALGAADAPRWLDEGFAYLHSSDFSLARAETLFGAVMRGKVLPLEALETAFPAREDEAALAYAEAYDFVVFLAQQGIDRAPFQVFLRALAGGAGLRPACRIAFGRSLDDLEREWSGSLRGRYLWFPVGVGSLVLWVFGALLLCLAWLRRRRAGRRTLRRWEIEEAAQDAEDARRSGHGLN
jgi:peptidase MA superfamily protein